MKFLNTLRKIERIRFLITLFLIGVLFIVLSAVVMSKPKPELVEVDGRIVNIVSYSDSSGEDQYEVYVSYTDKNGTAHDKVRYPSYSSSMKEGDAVKVLYAPAFPEEIQAPGGEKIPYIILAVGIVAVAVAVIGVAVGLKKANGNSPFENVERQIDPSLAEQVRNDDSPVREYYFHWTGKLNQSYILETPDRVPVYEAVCDHIGVFTPYRYTFTNRKTGMSKEHKVTHTVTSSYGGGADNGISLSLVSSSSFKIDGVNIWDHLADLGYSVELKRSGIKLNFDVLHHGVPVAYLEAAGANILKDDAKSVLGDKLPATGLYKVSCRDSEIEGVFTACFCVSRVEFF